MRLLRLITLAAAALALVACASREPVAYYLLTPEGPAPAKSGTGIGVGPVSVPAYLDRPNIVFQQGPHELAVAESHRWAGDLEDNIATVLAANLGRRLNTGNVRTYPWNDDETMRYQITVEVRHFHATAGGDAILHAAWRTYAVRDGSIVASRSWSGDEALVNDGYEALAAAQSRLLARLATAIADDLR